MKRSWILPAFAFFVALGARAWQLTFHSLWLDEAFSLFWASKPAAEIVRVGLTLTEDKHPPLYYLMLHGWTGIFGTGDVATRSLGVILGAVAVLPAYGLALHWSNGRRRVAFFAALLVAINPFLVWYSQEARMFGPATTFGLIGLYGWARAFPLPGGKNQHQNDALYRALWSALAIVGFLAACYTYLFSAFLLPVAALWWIFTRVVWQNENQITRLNARILDFLPGAAALAITTGLFLPLAWAAWQVSGAEATPGTPFANVFGTLTRLLEVYALRQVPWNSTIIAVILAAILAISVLGLRRTKTSVLLLIWLIVPLLLGNVMLAKDATVFAETRYFIFLVPALCLVWARGLDSIWTRSRLMGLLVSLAFFAVTFAALRYDWHTDSIYRREDWRTAASAVAAQATANDVVVNHVNYTQLAFARYYNGAAKLAAPFGQLLPDEASVEEKIDPLTSAETLWLVLSHQEGIDPANLVRAWLGGRFPLTTVLYPAGIEIRAYATSYRYASLPSDAHAITAPNEWLDGAVQLAACKIEKEPIRATDLDLHPPSGWTHITLYWRAARTPTRDARAVVRLVDSGGQIWGESLDRKESTLYFYPMTKWQPNELIRDDYDINLNPKTPSGFYNVVVTLDETPATQALCGRVNVR